MIATPQDLFAKQYVITNNNKITNKNKITGENRITGETENLNSRRSVIPHIIISAYEHKSILNAVDQL